MFALLMKGDFLDNSSHQKFTYMELLEENINISEKDPLLLLGYYITINMK